MAASTSMELKPFPVRGERKDRYELIISWTSGADGASTTTYSTDDATLSGTKITDFIKGRILEMGEVTPGATTPTDAFDVVVNDKNSVDMFGGGFVNCTNGSTTTAYPYDGTNYGTRYITGAITPQVTNAGDSKTGEIVLHIS